MRLLNTNLCILTLTRGRHPQKETYFIVASQLRWGVKSINHLHKKITTSERKLILPILCSLRNPPGKANGIFKYNQKSLTGETHSMPTALLSFSINIDCYLIPRDSKSIYYFFHFFSFSLSYKLSGTYQIKRMVYLLPANPIISLEFSDTII